MNTIEYFKERFDRLQAENSDSGLRTIRQKAFDSFTRLGIPMRHEEWKYTRISSLFNKEYNFSSGHTATSVSWKDLDAIRLPEYEEANELVFVNGMFSFPLSTIRSNQILVMPLEEAAKSEFTDIVTKHLGHSGKYLKDGINALNTAFVNNGVFVHVKKGQIVERPIYIYNIT